MQRFENMTQINDVNCNAFICLFIVMLYVLVSILLQRVDNYLMLFIV